MKRLLLLVALLIMATFSLRPQPAQAQSGVLWTTRFYNNDNLQDPPVLQRTDPQVAFNWGTGSPASGVNADHFSARFSTKTYFAAGVYEFTVQADDGVHLIFDNVNFLIDTFYATRPGETLTAQYTVNSPGEYHLQLDYHEVTGNAYVYLNWRYLGTSPVPPQPQPPTSPGPGGGIWTAEYFANQSLSGSPSIITTEASPTHNWGTGAPFNFLPADNFSARWRSTQFLDGYYRITAYADDGIRVYVDNSLVINAWTPNDGSQQYVADFTASRGNHEIRVEYFENGGAARLGFNLQNTGSPSPQPVPTGNWLAQYFAGTSLSGPVLLQNSDVPNQRWGFSAPASGIPADNFSARFSRQIPLAAGTYRIRARADDGVRVYLNGVAYINEWHNSDFTQYYTNVVTLAAGNYNFVVDYYEHGGAANLEVEFTSINIPSPQPQPQPQQPNEVAMSGTAIVRAGTLNVRNAPSTVTGQIIAKVHFTETYRVVARLADRSWYKITLSGGQTGWVSGRYVRVSSEQPAPPQPPAESSSLTTLVNLSLRQGPSTSTRRLTVIPRNTVVPVNGRTLDGGWFRVVYDGRIGWVSSDFVLLAQGLTLSEIPVF